MVGYERLVVFPAFFQAFKQPEALGNSEFSGKQKPLPFCMGFGMFQLPSNVRVGTVRKICTLSLPSMFESLKVGSWCVL